MFLSVQEAADSLDVTCPYVVRLMDSGRLPFHKAGKHRRVRLVDLMAYKQQQDQISEQALTELAEQAQELSLGY